MKPIYRILLFVCVLSGVGVFAWCLYKRSESHALLHVGSSAPKLVLLGTHLPLENHRTFLLFYTHSCNHCAKTIQSLASLRQSEPSLFAGITVLLISEDGESSVHSSQFESAMDANQETAEAYGVRHVPVIVTIDTDSSIRSIHLGELNAFQEEGFLRELAK